MPKYYVNFQKNKAYNSNLVELTAQVSQGALIIEMDDHRVEVIVLNECCVRNQEKYLEFWHVTSRTSALQISFSSKQKLEECQAEVSKWSEREMKSTFSTSKDVLGKGMNGTVFQGRLLGKVHGDARVAIKRLYNSSFRTDLEVAASVFLEPHDNVINILDVLRDKNYTYIVLPLLENAHQIEDLIIRKFITMRDAKHYMKQVLEGVAFIHRQGLSHGDIHTGNILLQNNNNENNEKKITIIDFGKASFGHDQMPDDLEMCGRVLGEIEDSIKDELDSKGIQLYEAMCDRKITAFEALRHPWFQ